MFVIERKDIIMAKTDKSAKPPVERLESEEKKKALMLNELAVGDTVLTTSGFYGTIIDIADDTVIVEFGNNRNCRIPMQKAAVAVVEKPEDAQ